ncbi:transposase [Azospirillum sp. YIM DDC1]|uniref:Transposase n=1 Tax=Azospirillum aestuarii TaxID=2802052 RepID=A0ABS1I7M7_9PROT|nr:transposase [Azospirillum aestuarii]
MTPRLLPTPEKLSSYFGLTPTTHQSGDQPRRARRGLRRPGGSSPRANRFAARRRR